MAYEDRNPESERDRLLLEAFQSGEYVQTGRGTQTREKAEGRKKQADEIRNLALMALMALTTYGGATVPASRAAQGGFERLALEGRRRKGAGMGAEVLEREALATQQRTGAYGMGRANRMTEPDIANWYLSGGAPQVAPRVAISPGRTGYARNPAEVTGRGPWQPEDPRMLVSGFSGRTGGWGRPDAPVWDMSHLTQAQRRRAFNDYTRDRTRWLAAQ